MDPVETLNVFFFLVACLIAGIFTGKTLIHLIIKPLIRKLDEKHGTFSFKKDEPTYEDLWANLTAEINREDREREAANATREALHELAMRKAEMEAAAFKVDEESSISFEDRKRFFAAMYELVVAHDTVAGWSRFIVKRKKDGKYLRLYPNSTRADFYHGQEHASEFSDLQYVIFQMHYNHLLP